MRSVRVVYEGLGRLPGLRLLEDEDLPQHRDELGDFGVGKRADGGL